MTESQYEEIMLALRGDMKNPGLVQNVLKVMNDIYIPVEGISPRLRELERWRLVKEERAAGAIWMARIVWSIASAIVGAVLALLLKR